MENPGPSLTEDYSFVHWIANDVQDSRILKGELNDSEEMWSCTAEQYYQTTSEKKRKNF
ncbi:hypothetical protein AGMMS49925_07610 [Deltaproteobacteria bacterium]|nr:hypothetical protein AGMMS49925_07610 [Deltaproteobacteria bacterium]